MNNQEKNKIPKGTSFTPVFDHLVGEIGLIKTAIIGVIWRYSQMSDKVCRASQNSIATRLNLTRQTLNKHLLELINLAYVQDLTPKVRNQPHIYLLTNKVFNKIKEREIRIKSGTILEKSEIARIKTNPCLSIFELFGVNNLYLKKEEKKIEVKREKDADDAKKHSIRNISSSQLVDLLVDEEPSKFTDIDPLIEIDVNDPIHKVVNFLNFGFLWHIFTFETDLLDEIKIPFSKTRYKINEKGIRFIRKYINNDPDSIDLDQMSEIVDFWFWNSIEGNARIEDIEMLFSIYDNNQLPVYELENPEVYRRSQEIRVITRVIGKEPPLKLFPKIYKSFDVINPLKEFEYLKGLYDNWISLGHKSSDLSWFFNLYN